MKDALEPPPPVLDSSLPGIKCLAYADDVRVLLKNEQNLNHLRLHIGRYAAVSSDKFNEDKSEAYETILGEYQEMFISIRVEQEDAIAKERKIISSSYFWWFDCPGSVDSTTGASKEMAGLLG